LPIFTKQFATVDKYEEWLEDASGRINVLSIDNAPQLFSASDQKHTGPITIRYQTHDKSLAPHRGMASRIVEIVIVAAAFFAAFLYLISRA
jgi:hypothetical protein